MQMTQIKDIRILIVDDHTVVRKGLIHVLSTSLGLKVIAEAESGEEALFLSQKLKPDIVIMDVSLGGLSGVEATELIMNHNPKIRILGLSTFADEKVVHRMFKAGARGYLRKDVSAQELTSSIKRIYDGEFLAPPDFQMISNDADHLNPNITGTEPVVKMGEQQKKVLALMTKGFTNPEIAGHLNISLPTARYHVSAILQKLDVSNRAEAVALAIRNNLIDENHF